MSTKLTLQDALKYPNAKIVRYAKEMLSKKISDYQNIIELIKRSWFLDIGDCKLILRTVDSLTDEEKFEVNNLSYFEINVLDVNVRDQEYIEINLINLAICDYLRSINIDIDGFIASGKAVAE